MMYFLLLDEVANTAVPVEGAGAASVPSVGVDVDCEGLEWEGAVKKRQLVCDLYDEFKQPKFTLMPTLG